MSFLETDKAVYEAVQNELKRQSEHIELIASENFVSNAVLEAQGSVMTNKYAEGYPGKRYYGGCENVDVVENIARDRVKELFGCKYANVQPHSGSQANMAVYRALLEKGDVVLGMALDHGGHLTHGYNLNFSGCDYKAYSYGLDPETETINYDEVLRIAQEVKPKMIVAGASAYPRKIDFAKFRDICDKVGAYLFVDMAHIAGLVAAGDHMSPIPYADVVTSTTHKTLRGPRGGIILTNNEDLAKKIDKTIFPGIQGGPLMHVIAGKAVAFGEALTDEFKEYSHQVVKNANVLGQEMMKRGYHVVSNGTDNHLILLDVKSATGLTGKKAENILHRVNITCNKNTIPNDTEKPFITSGLRLGSPAVTSRGFKEADMVLVAEYIDEALRNCNNEEVLDQVKAKVIALTSKYPLPY